MLTITYEELFSFNNLYKAYIQSRRGKRDRKQLVNFEFNTLNNLYKLHNELINQTYIVGRYNAFIVKVPKKREIQTLKYSDRIVQRVICNEMAPYFTRKAIFDNCVCQVGKGTHFALKRFEEKLRKFIRQHGTNGYILKCDILKYFPSLSHDVLINIFCNEIKDKKLKNLLIMIIQSYHTKKEYLEKYNISNLGSFERTKRGVPIGNQTSQIFGMFYLNSLDRMIKEKYRVKIYSRYMDDFVIVHEDKSYIKELLNAIRKKVDSLHLQLNSKTQIFPIKNGITYLGFRYQVSKTGKLIKKVSDKTAKRFKNKSKFIELAYNNGYIDRKRVMMTLNAYHGHLKYANCNLLEKKVTHKILKKIRGQTNV